MSLLAFVVWRYPGGWCSSNDVLLVFFCLVKKLYNPRVKEKEPTNEAIKRLDDNDTVDGSEIRRSPVDME